MASTSKYTGASYTENELADPDLPAAIRIRRPEIGYVDQTPKEDKENPSSPQQGGGDSTQSSAKRETANDKPNPSPRKAARSTANRSKSHQQASGTAHSTDGDTPETETESAEDFEFDIDDFN